ncbi:MAG TPA: hypothetical protein VJ787_10995, partial [Thermoleophilia bacterium]|nr:hypothetical protein [Thermoleophilia bacterium]
MPTVGHTRFSYRRPHGVCGLPSGAKHLAHRSSVDCLASLAREPDRAQRQQKDTHAMNPTLTIDLDYLRTTA